MAISSQMRAELLLGGEFFLPPWTLAEMLDDKVMPLHVLPQKVVEERFDIFGGCARIVLEEDDNVFIKDRERLEGALNSADALSTLEISFDMKAISKNTHTPSGKDASQEGLFVV